MLTALLIAAGAALVVASAVTGSVPLTLAGMVLALGALAVIAWPALMRRRAAAVAAEEDEEAEKNEVAEEDEVAEEVDAEPTPEPAPEPVPEPAVAPVPGAVLVVPGRRRFHLEGCAMLEGRDTDELAVEEAREEGFSPCSRCVGQASAA